MPGRLATTAGAGDQQGTAFTLPSSMRQHEGSRKCAPWRRSFGEVGPVGALGGFEEVCTDFLARDRRAGQKLLLECLEGPRQFGVFIAEALDLSSRSASLMTS